MQLTLIIQLAYPDNPGHPWANCAGREQGCHNCGVISFCRNLFSRGESNSCVPRLPRCSVDIRGRSWIEHPLIQNIVRSSLIEDSTCPTCKHNLRVIFSECDRCRETYGQQIIINRLSKAVILILILLIFAPAVAMVFIERYVPYHGFPKAIINDKGI